MRLLQKYWPAPHGLKQADFLCPEHNYMFWVSRSSDAGAANTCRRKAQSTFCSLILKKVFMKKATEGTAVPILKRRRAVYLTNDEVDCLLYQCRFVLRVGSRNPHYIKQIASAAMKLNKKLISVRKKAECYTEPQLTYDSPDSEEGYTIKSVEK